jgi:hypothetical protein
MKQTDVPALIARRWALLCLVLMGWVALLTPVRAGLPVLIPSVIVGNTLYSNVIVRETAERSVTISHTRGMATLSVDKMTRREKENLGLIAPEPEPLPKTNTPLPSISLGSFGSIGSPEDREAALTEAKEFLTRLKSPEGLREVVQNIPPLRAKDFIAPVATYLLLSMCFVVICAKAGKPSPLLGWIPLVQMFPLYRAAKMSPFWFVAMMLNVFFQLTLLSIAATKGLPERALMIGGCVGLVLAVVHLVGWIIWCFRISKARGKSPLVGFLLLLPVVNLFALVYLTFSGSGSPAPLPKVAPATIGLRIV